MVEEGYQILLIKRPMLWKLRQINLNSIEQLAVNEAEEKFLHAGIIERRFPLQPPHDSEGKKMPTDSGLS